MVVFGQNCCILVKWLYSSKVDVIGQNGCVRAIVVVFRQKWLYSGKSGCIREKWLYSGKKCCIRAKLLYLCKLVYSDKVVVFGQSEIIRANVVVLG